MFRYLGSALLVGFGLMSVAPRPTAAQDIRYTTVNRAEFGGALGRIINLFGGSDPTESVTSIKGLLMRTDDDESSFIMDAEARRFTWLDHGAKTYFTSTMEEMIEAGAQTVQEVSDSIEAAQARAPDAEDPEMDYTLRFSVDRTGEHQMISGYDAERVFFTVEIDAVPTEQPKEEDEEENTQGATLVFLTDSWLSADFPAWGAAEAQGEEWAEALRDESSAAMSQAFSFDPRIQAGLERMAEEMEGIEGTAIKTVTHVVALPLGMNFDREQVLRDADQKLSVDVADAAAGAAKEGVANAVRGRLGRFGRRSEEPKEPEVEMKQSTFMRVFTEVTNVETATLLESLFQPPADYAQRTTFMPTGS